MGNPRRVIRKVQREYRKTFDDHLWPTFLALVLFGGFLCGVIDAYLEFDDPRWYANAWTAIVALPFAIGSLMLLLVIVDARRGLRRPVQFAIVLSIICNVALVLAMDREVFSRLMFRVAQPSSQPRREIVVPEYYRRDAERQPDWMKPLEESVSVEPVPEQVVPPRQPREQTSEVEQAAKPQIVPVPQPVATADPNVLRRRQLNQAQPRRADQPTPLSRRAQRATPQLSRPQAEAVAAVARNVESMKPTAARMARQDTEVPQQQSVEVQPRSVTATPDVTLQRKRATDQSPQMTPQRESREVARRETPTRPSTNQTVPTELTHRADPPSVQPQPVSLPRKRQSPAREQAIVASTAEPVAVDEESRSRNVSRRSPQRQQLQIAALPQPSVEVRAKLTTRPAASTSQSQVAVPESRSEATTQQPEPVATARAVTRKASTSPPVTGSLPQPTADRAPVESTRVAGRVPARRRVAPPEDGPAATATSRELERRSSAPSGLNVPTRVAQVNTNQGPQASNQPEPTPTLAKRVRQASPDGAATQPAAAPRGAEDARSRSVQRRREMDRRAALAAVPTIAPLKSPGAPARALTQSERAQAPVALSRPSASQARESNNTSQTELNASALAPGRIGTAGTGAGPNLDRGRRTGANPAALASGSRVRKRPTEEEPRAVALHSASASEMPRARGSQPLPEATLAAQPVETATRAGSERPAASASAAAAAIARSQANEAQGPTADAGQVEVDLGPTRLVAADREFRPAGGGQPRQGPATPRLPNAEVVRRRPDLASLDTNQVAEQAAAPAASGGGTPLSAQPDSQALARVRRDRGGESPKAAATTALAGPVESSQSSAVSVIATLSRSRRDQSQSPGQGPTAEGALATRERQESALRIQRQRTAPAPESAAVSTALTAVAGEAGAATAELGPVAAETSRERQPVTGATQPSGRLTRPAEAGFNGDRGRVMRRTEQAGATAGPVVAGGGSRSPQRAAVGPRLEPAVVSSVAGLPAADTRTDATAKASLRSQSLQGRKTTAGGGRAAEIAAELPSPGRVSTEASGPQRRQATVGEPVVTAADGLAGTPTGTGPTKRAAGPTLVNGPVGVEEPAISAAGAARGDVLESLDAGVTVRRRRTESLAVDLEAPRGIGGLGRTAGREAGLPDRRAMAEQQEIQSRTVRFARRELGGLPDFSPTVANAVESFRRREERRRALGGAGSSSRGSRTEAAIERGLMFLARHQNIDGRWELSGFNEAVSINSDTAATGLALLCFTGGAYSHREGKYADTVDRGLKFLLANQRENGDLYIEMETYSSSAAWLYSHSIASIALCEAYGMTQDPALKESAQRAIDFILAAQHPERGGWRYSPRKGSDTSVTGWMLMALYSARLAGLDVRDEAWPKLHNWLDMAQAGPREPHLYRYNPFAPNTPQQGHGREATKTMTAVGLLLRFYASGWRRDNQDLLRGADYLLEHPPANGTVARPQRDTYYWYYATQVMFHVGGERWKRWWDPLSTMLRTEQLKEGPLAGSWDPRTPVPDRWGPHAGRHYVTTLNLLSLEVRWRHLPIYDDYAQGAQGEDADVPAEGSSN
ncbi:MAG: hypothetical protein CMJ75_15650 [Planctomycetaceae bacterium]|nr:hypothetical protein [Planctomycetaceae bacterium]